MSIVIIALNKDLSRWITAFNKVDENLDVSIWPETGDQSEITCAVVWGHPAGSLTAFPNLKLICSMGAGVDHVLKDPELPDGVPIVRIVDDGLSFSMSNYVVSAVMYHHRRFDKYLADKSAHVWDPSSPSEVAVKIGIMGFGVLGQEAGKKLKALGFEVVGYSNSRKNVKGIKCFAGNKELDAFLREINVLVCLLPATPDTKGMLNSKLFTKMNKGTFLINAARGQHQVTNDIIDAIDNGTLSGAFLDVFENEPLQKNHPVWDHPKVFITPHIASITNPDAAAPQIVANYKAMLAGLPLKNKIDRDRGY
ncbi:glyoxylate/hydroxypyruvate reductase A [Imperialibacter roseus]|uniref:Glyoxylate/hydroxypyruvate reductase A n=1 Tax=Imperialibacter roseus TaxID=1324217 RepID=A0ABZ0IY52_9BACT|nr:glyoxylate/hydroxypyruvate reductase A [Imperialibacter roseus]WOK09447.1 glyoxylate/hydroxypyruvate reductase A [Imperialibacter roseus]